VAVVYFVTFFSAFVFWYLLTSALDDAAITRIRDLFLFLVFAVEVEKLASFCNCNITICTTELVSIRIIPNGETGQYHTNFSFRQFGW